MNLHSHTHRELSLLAMLGKQDWLFLEWPRLVSDLILTLKAYREKAYLFPMKNSGY